VGDVWVGVVWLRGKIRVGEWCCEVAGSCEEQLCCKVQCSTSLQPDKYLYVCVLKRQLLTKEYYTLQTSMEKRVAELEVQVTEKSIKLETYEKLEHELDEVVMQAADGKRHVCLLMLGLQLPHQKCLAGSITV